MGHGKELTFLPHCLLPVSVRHRALRAHQQRPLHQRFDFSVAPEGKTSLKTWSNPHQPRAEGTDTGSIRSVAERVMEAELPA